MSRFKGVPPTYHPGLTISSRAQPEGGRLLVDVRCVPDAPPCSARELVVLIHGFNNHLGEAAEGYQGFRDRQYPLADASPPAFEGGLGDFFWPGDADWAGLFDKADFLVYPAAVHVVPGAAELLAGYLRTLPNLLTVHFVGHSLGCRVTLECMKQLVEAPSRPQIGQVVLMAAAVPDFKVDVSGEFADALYAARSVLVLHSTADTVLRFAFPPGQTIAGAGEGLLPTALGRSGPPGAMAGSVSHHQVANAAHGDYWGVRDPSISAMSEEARRVVAAYVSAFLPMTRLKRDIGFSRSIGAAPGDPSRGASSTRYLKERAIGARDVVA